MTDPQLSRSLSCPACQAPVETTEVRELFHCRYCGTAIYNDSRDASLLKQRSERGRANADRWAEMLAQDPQLSERLSSWQATKRQHAASGDRQAWKKVATKIAQAMAPLSPEPLSTKAQTRALEHEALQVFEPELRKLQQRLTQVSTSFSHRDPVGWVRRYVEAFKALRSALYAHPDFSGPPYNPEEAEGLAREQARSMLVAYEASLGPERVRAVLIEAFEEQTSGRCVHCGAPTQKDGSCPACGGKVHVEGPDAWIERAVSQWAAMPRSKDMIPAALAAVMPRSGKAPTPTPASLLRFLLGVYGSMRARTVIEGVKTARFMVKGPHRKVLKPLAALIEAEWPKR